MSLEITLFTKTTSKTSLIKFLLSEGFKKSRHFLEEMNNPETIHFMWYNLEDYQSTSGVEATVYKISTETQQKYECSDWVLHTRTRINASYEDKQKQNEIIKKARQKFKGTFYNDWYGTNIYTNLNDYNKYTPLEKSISIIASNSLKKLNHINNCLSNYNNPFSDTIANTKINSLKEILKTEDPSTILYNSLMPFLVSVLEYFYGQCFVNFLKYDNKAKELLLDEKLKIVVSDVISIIQNENSLEQIIAQSFNFQNLESINKAYKKYLFMDIYSILSKKKKVNKNIFRILNKIQEILEARHKFVHELNINYDLTKEQYLDYLVVIDHAIQLTLQSFKTKGLEIQILD